MGLGFQVEGYDCKANWSYSGFQRFRVKVAKTLNLDLMRMTRIELSELDPDWMMFFKHSDFEGTFTSEECGRLAPKLEAVIKGWLPSDFDFKPGMHFVEAMKYCAQENKEMLFI